MSEAQKRPNQVTMDLGTLKKPWLAWCEAQGLKPTAAFKEIVSRLVARQAAQASPTATPAVVPDSPEKAKHRKWVVLTDSELAHAQAFADREGFSIPKWLHALVRARLTGAPQLGQQELELLAESNLRLLAIGRNLNQVARVLNGNPNDRSFYRVALIEELESVIKAHTKVVSAAMTANVERWRIK